jgi:hypothetical protein
MSKLENPTYSYDNDGHLHVPPLQPGRLPPQISAPGSSTAAASGASSGSSVSGFFGGLFGSRNTAPTRVATTDTSSQTHTGFFGSLFGSHDTAQPANTSGDAEQTATTPPAKPKSVARNEPAAAAGLRPRINTEPPKSEPQVADTTKPKTAPPTAPQKEANVAPPPANNNGNNGLLSGAQPVVPAGSFNNRWGGFQ